MSDASPLPLIGTHDYHRGVAAGLDVAATLLRGRDFADPAAVVAFGRELERLASREHVRIARNGGDFDVLTDESMLDDVDKAGATC